MKTLFKTFALCIILLLTENAFTQTLSFGGRVGVNVATVTISDDVSGLSLEPGSITGINIGALLNIGITDAFSIQPELSFVQKGFTQDFKFENPFTGETEEYKNRLTLNYIEVPVLAKYAFGGETIQGFVQGGPSFGFAGSGEIESDGEKADVDFEEDLIKRGDLSVVFGGGLGLNAGPGQLFVDVRYMLGLNNFSDETEDEATTVHNRGLGLGLGYIVILGK